MRPGFHMALLAFGSHAYEAACARAFTRRSAGEAESQEKCLTLSPRPRFSPGGVSLRLSVSLNRGCDCIVLRVLTCRATRNDAEARPPLAPLDINAQGLAAIQEASAAGNLWQSG